MVEKYGDKIANLGGIDTDVLASIPRNIREYVIDCLDRVKGHGGIAFGTRQPIPDYVPTEVTWLWLKRYGNGDRIRNELRDRQIIFATWVDLILKIG